LAGFGGAGHGPVSVRTENEHVTVLGGFSEQASGINALTLRLQAVREATASTGVQTAKSR